MARQQTQWILELVDKVTSPIRSVTKSVTGFTSSTAQATLAVDRLEKRGDVLGKRLAKISLFAGGFMLLAQSSFAFEEGMAKVNTMAGVGEAQLAALTGQVRELATVVPLARTELSDGLYQTISNGVPENNWIDFLNASSKAAVGGVAEVGDVVSVTSTIIKNYALEWNKAGAIQDKIQNTAKLGKTSFAELAGALPAVTGNAATLNVGLDELLGTFGALTGVTGSTAEVGTQMNAILGAMVKPTREATQMAQKLGIQFDALSIQKAGGLKNFFDILTTSVDKYSQKTGTATTTIYGQLFSSQEALRAFLPLTSSVANDFANKTQQIANSAGVIDGAFNEMSKTANAQMQLARNSFSNTMDKFTTALQPLMVNVLGVVSSVFSMIGGFADANPILFRAITIFTALTVGSIALTTAIALMGNNMMIAAIKNNFLLVGMQRVLVGMQRVLVTSGALLVRTVMLAGAIVGQAVVALVTWTAAQVGLNIAMNANPIGLIILGITALVGVVAIAIKYWNNITAAFGRFVQMIDTALSGAFPALWNGVKAIFENIFNWFTKIWDKIVGAVRRVGKWVGITDGATVNVKGEANGKAFEVKAQANDGKAGGKNPLDNAMFGGGAGQPFNPNALNTGAGTGGGTNATGTGGGKSLTMTLNIENVFNVNGDGDFERNRERMVDYIVGKLNDRLRDSAIQMG